MIGVLLSVPYALFHLILNSNPCGGHYLTHFVDEESEARQVKAKLMCMDGARIQSKLPCFHTFLLHHIASSVKLMVILTPVSI